MHHKTKIVATLGPATTKVGTVKELVSAGVNVFRLNLSHGTHEEHRRRIDVVRSLTRKANVALLADLQGPKIRTGQTENDVSVFLKKGRRITVTPRKTRCTEQIVSVDYPGLVGEVEPGRRILLNDGAVGLRVESVDTGTNALTCVVLNDGSYSSRKGVNLPHTALGIPSFTAKDRRDLAFALGMQVDFVALSFVREADDLKPLRQAVKRSGGGARIIAKIEKPEAAENVGPILDSCDGIMVARGDLGVEASTEDVPVLQKGLIDEANQRGKIVIVATQMLESMVSAPRPTRAEASDVANAILDGADAVMLSAETSVGAYPVAACETMRRIIQSAESSRYYSTAMQDLTLAQRYAPHSVCEAAAWASRDLGGAPVLVFTMSGGTALYLAKIRCQAPIYVFSPHPRVVSQMALAWNSRGFEVSLDEQFSKLQQTAERTLLRERLVRKGQTIVIVGGTTPVRGATNFLRVKKVGEL